MSDGSRFGWSLKGHNRVTHRERGVILNITKAHDVFVSIPLEVMQEATGARAEKFCQLIIEWRDGTGAASETSAHRDFINNPFHKGDAILSPIINPAKPFNRDW